MSKQRDTEATNSFQASNWSGCPPIDGTGTWLLEASAGTGKTWQLASLVARMVVERGVDIDRILVITFTRAATAELRDRARKRLVEVRDVLRQLTQPRPSGAPANADMSAHPAALQQQLREDAVLLHLCGKTVDGQSLSEDVLRLRLDRVNVALSSFDLAPISTIHGFTQRMLESLAFESGQDAGLQLLDDDSAVREELVSDALASVLAQANETELSRWTALGWNQSTLAKSAALASSVQGRVIVPAGGAAIDTWKHEEQVALRALATFWSTDGATLRAEVITRAQARPKSHLRAAHKVERLRSSSAQIDLWLQQFNSAPSQASAPPLKDMGVFGAEKLSQSSAKHREPLQHALGAQADAVTAELEQAQLRAAPLAAFARAARAKMDDVLRARRVITFDAMLMRLATAIEVERDRGGPRPLRDAIAAMYDVALVDEFQDTDHAQWTVLREVFVDSDAHQLFLIGDPKQAIYRFRGADVHVYLQAKKAVEAQQQGRSGGSFTMRRNFRSDSEYVRACNRLWGEARRSFGELSMDYVIVDTPTRQRGWRLRDAPPIERPHDGLTPRRPLEVRWLDGPPNEEVPGLSHLISNKADGLLAAAESCAAEIRELLQSGAHLAQSPAANPASSPPPRLLRPGDFAVLVHEHAHGVLVKQALARHGIMSVAGGKRSVFESKAAAWLVQLLKALAQPTYEPLARALAVSPMFGWTLAQLDRALRVADGQLVEGNGATQTAQPLRWDRWRTEIRDWASAWEKQRFAGVLQQVLTCHAVLPRLLQLEDGERHATDLRHLFELSHVEERRQHHSPGSLARWLLNEREQATRLRNEANSLRLESDAAAVQVVTTYKAKGLQYPIVMLPFAWAAKNSDAKKPGPLVVHPADSTDGGSVLDFHSPGSDARTAAENQHKQEEQQERLRKLYVELTRAQHHCVLWVGPIGREVQGSPAHALLFRSDDCQRDPFKELTEWAKDLCAKPAPKTIDAGKIAAKHEQRRKATSRAKAQLQALCAADSAIGWSEVRSPPRPRSRWRPPSGAKQPQPLQTLQFGARSSLISAWQRASYTSIAQKLGHGVASTAAETEPRSATDDEAIRPGTDEAISAPRSEPQESSIADNDSADNAPLHRMWGGARVGTWVHAVLEMLDFQATRALVEADFEAWRQRAPGSARDEAVRAIPYRLAAPSAAAGTSLLAQVRALGARHGHRRSLDHADLVLALPHILGAPLSVPGQHAWRPQRGFHLGAIHRRDRIDELAFDLSLAGGEAWQRRLGHQRGPRVRPELVATALRHRLAPSAAAATWDGDPWLRALVARVDEGINARRAWAGADPTKRGPKPSSGSPIPAISGMLTGFIDLVFRAPSLDGKQRVYLADYKTNRVTSLSPAGVKAPDYRRAALAAAMAHSHYHLQSLLYTLALHRYLRSRIPAYDYDEHFGGHFYLFVRGMARPWREDDPSDVHGVWADRWPRAVIEALDGALDERFSLTSSSEWTQRPAGGQR